MSRSFYERRRTEKVSGCRGTKPKAECDGGVGSAGENVALQAGSRQVVYSGDTRSSRWRRDCGRVPPAPDARGQEAGDCADGPKRLGAEPRLPGNSAGRIDCALWAE